MACPGAVTGEETVRDLACPACAGAAPKALVERHEGFEIRRCGSCGLEFASPMRAAPPEWYDAPPSGVRWEFEEVLRRYPGEGRRLLDIGCARGTFLELARRHDYRVTGIDFNPRSLAVARGRYGLVDLHAGTLAARLDAWRDRFDLVTAFHILEHIEDPAKFLTEVRSVLKPGGVLVVAVPNPRRAFLRLRREHWDYPPHHLTRWTPESLRAVFVMTGFGLLELWEESVTPRGLLRYPDAYREFLHVGAGWLLDLAKRVTPYRFREVSRAAWAERNSRPRLGAVEVVRIPKMLVRVCSGLVGVAYGTCLVWAMRGAPGLSLCAVAGREM